MNIKRNRKFISPIPGAQRKSTAPKREGGDSRSNKSRGLRDIGFPVPKSAEKRKITPGLGEREKRGRKREKYRGSKGINNEQKKLWKTHGTEILNAHHQLGDHLR